MAQKKILMRFRVNGEDVEVAAPSNRLLIDVLREELSLTGTKLGVMMDLAAHVRFF